MQKILQVGILTIRMVKKIFRRFCLAEDVAGNVADACAFRAKAMVKSTFENKEWSTVENK